MKTSMIYLTLLLFLITGSMKAQDLVMATNLGKPSEKSPSAVESKKTFLFYAFSQDEKLRSYNLQSLESHYLGESIARKMNLFNETYTVKTPLSPGNPTMKISIRKPLIYSSVKKIEKQLKKDIKNNIINTETAENLYSKVLDIAINIVNDNTEDFEREIKTSEGTQTLLELYTQRVILSYL